MEPDCADTKAAVRTDPTMLTQDSIFKMLDAISSQMLQNYQTLQVQLTQTAEDVRRISQDNDTFRQEIRNELDTIRSSTVLSGNNPGIQPNAVLSVTASPPLIQSAVTPSASTTVSTSSSNSVDFQSQMLLMLNETFSKLSTALTETKTTDSKSEWPKFSGDSKHFRTWYLAIMTQLSIHPWSALYDPGTNSIVSNTTDTLLNSKLYAKLISSLEGPALQNMVACKHIQANALLLIRELQQMYKPKNVPEVIAAKTGEFWSSTKRLSHETVDAYYNRFQELLEDLSEADEVISDKSAIRHFIFTLGPDFESIQNSYHLGNLPAEWKTVDWPSILVLCRDYYNSINPQGPPKKDQSSDGNSNLQA